MAPPLCEMHRTMVRYVVEGRNVTSVDLADCH